MIPSGEWKLRLRMMEKSVFGFLNFVQFCVFLRCELWKSLSHSTVCDPMDYTVHGILQARILEWVAVPFSRGSSQPRDRTQDSRIAGSLFTAAPQGKPKNTGGLSLSIPSPAALPDPGIKPGSPSLQADLFQLAIREDRRGLPIWGIRAGMTNFHAAKEECLG